MTGFVVKHEPEDLVNGETVKGDVLLLGFAKDIDTAYRMVINHQSRRIEAWGMSSEELADMDLADWLAVDKSDYSIIPVEKKRLI